MPLRSIDLRTATWRDIQGHLVNLRASVYEALQEHGPCTTRGLAQAMETDILTVRPRVTELVQLGLVVCSAAQRNEGIYSALTLAEAEDAFIRRQAEAQKLQLEFPI